MDREILFRGKRISNGKWVEGGILQQSHPNFDHGNCYCICANNKDYFVEQNTIGQYIGLTDKNGRKIFEGDICLFNSSYINDEHNPFSINWDPVGVKYVIKSNKWTVDFDSYYGDECEVIGNIFDNPELVAGG